MALSSRGVSVDDLCDSSEKSFVRTIFTRNYSLKNVFKKRSSDYPNPGEVDLTSGAGKFVAMKVDEKSSVGAMKSSLSGVTRASENAVSKLSIFSKKPNIARIDSNESNESRSSWYLANCEENLIATDPADDKAKFLNSLINSLR